MGLSQFSRFLLYSALAFPFSISLSLSAQELQRTIDSDPQSMFTTTTRFTPGNTERIDGASATNNNQGKVQRLQVDGTLIAETAGPANSSFGRDLELTDQDDLIVGAPDENSGKGAVYVFQRNLIGTLDFSGGTPPGVERLGYPGQAAQAQIGKKIKYINTPNGRFIITGAAASNEVIGFKKIAGTWQHRFTIQAPSGTSFGFGSGIAVGDMDGDGQVDDLAIGDPFAKPAGPTTGAVYIKNDIDTVSCSGCQLTYDHTLFDLSQIGQEFGESVDFEGGLLAVGAPAYDRTSINGPVPDSGAAYVYDSTFANPRIYGVFPADAQAGIAVSLLEMDNTTNPATIDLAISARNLNAGQVQIFRVSTPDQGLQDVLAFEQSFVYDAPIAATPVGLYPDLDLDGALDYQLRVHTVNTPPQWAPDENASIIKKGLGLTAPTNAFHQPGYTAACMKSQWQNENWLAMTINPVLSQASGFTTSTPRIGHDYSLQFEVLPRNPAQINFIQELLNQGKLPKLAISAGDEQQVSHRRYNPCFLTNNTTYLWIENIDASHFDASNVFRLTKQLDDSVPQSLNGVELNAVALIFWRQPLGAGQTIEVGMIGESLKAVVGP